MARVKTDDHKFESASALADYLDAARRPNHPGMRLGEIITVLEACDAAASVQFDFGGFEPTEVDSYRGYYSDLAIGFAETGGLSVGALLGELRQADGATFTGYKGGEYRMDKSTPVWVANCGRSHGVAVIGVDNKGWRVVLRTALID